MKNTEKSDYLNIDKKHSTFHYERHIQNFFYFNFAYSY